MSNKNLTEQEKFIMEKTSILMRLIQNIGDSDLRRALDHEIVCINRSINPSPDFDQNEPNEYLKYFIEE